MTSSTPLAVGQVAPDFSAPDQQDHTHILSQYRGQWVILYFYPKDDTPGCTTEACSFRDVYHELQDKAVLLGVSSDSVASHQKFADKYQLPFPLLADPDKKIIAAYGADGTLFKKRITFLIDSEGTIAKIYPNVDVKKHAAQILKDLPT